jgi:preprotein translocase subunit SecB
MTEQPQSAEIALERFYLKDLSFESPRSPDVFREPWQPTMNVDINTRTQALGDDRYEVVLTVTANAKSPQGKTALIVEIQQAGIFRVKGLEGPRLQRVLATFCPNLLFPYARETLDSVVVKGTFPAIMLAPVNFDALYEQALRQQAQKEPVQH